MKTIFYQLIPITSDIYLNIIKIYTNATEPPETWRPSSVVAVSYFAVHMT